MSSITDSPTHPMPSLFSPPPSAFLRAMRRAHGSRFVFLYAPAGFGKASYLKEWLGSSPLRAQWLALDAFDNALPRLCDDLAMLLTRFQPSNSLLMEAAASNDDSLERLLSCVMRLRPPEEGSGALVLENLHALLDENCRDMLTLFLQRLSGNLPVYLLSDASPFPQLSTLAIQGEMATLSMDDMRLETADVRALWQQRGIALAPKEDEELVRSAFGWPLAIHAMLDAANGGNPLDMDGYLDEHIWPSWEQAEQTLLLRTCFLQTLPTGLCDQLTRRDDSAVLLARMVESSAFIRRAGQDVWQVSDLLRRYLSKKSQHLLKPSLLQSLYHTAAVWHYEHGDYIAAMDDYILKRDHAGIVASIDTMSHPELENSVERLYHNANNHSAKLPEGFIDDKSDLLAYHAWYSYLEGNADKFCATLDKMQAAPDKKGGSRGAMLDVIFFVPALDFRYTLSEMTALQAQSLRADNAPPFTARAGRRPSINSVTQNFPYAHRSMRDFSEISESLDESCQQLRAAFGSLLGDEYDVLEACIKGGILYEKSMLSTAYLHALSAYEALSAQHGVEFRFCALMLLEKILRAMGRPGDAADIIREVERLTAKKNGSHLRANLEACKLYDLNMPRETGKAWLEKCSASGDEELYFFRIPQYFATLRALIATGQNQQAILHGSRLRKLVSDYRRPLDITETSLLLSIAHWRSGSKKIAASMFIEACKLAQMHRYTQLFVEHRHHLKPLHSHIDATEGFAALHPLFYSEVIGIILQNSEDLRDYLFV